MASHINFETVPKVDLKLPTLPGVAQKLLEIFEKDPPDLEKAGQILSLDAPLSAKLMKAVNASLYGSAHKILSVNQAIPLLGADAVKNLALSFSLAPNFRPAKGSGTTYSQFWKESLVAAIAARAVSGKVNPELSEGAVSCGLLQNIGSLILAESFPEKYEMVLEENRHGTLPLVEAESKMFGLDHTVLGEYAIRKWGLPNFFAEPIRCHHKPEAFSGPAKERSMMQILHLASLFTDAFCSLDPRPQFNAVDRYLDSCGYAEMIVSAEINRQVSAEVNSIFPIFDIEIDQSEHIRIIESAKQKLAGVSEEIIVRLKKQANAIEQLKKQSATDGLTKLYNQKHFLRTLKNEIERAHRHATPLSMVMADIDNFKTINDFHGHLTGDYVLKIIASRMQEALRGSDYLARYGGEEFAAILPLTSLHEASFVTERLRKTVRSTPILYKGKSLSLTMSFGIATLTLNQRTEMEGFIHMADEALYEAKNSGKDKCCIYRAATFDRAHSIVLIVDDEPVVLETMSKMLERLGFGVITAKDGNEALTFFGKHENIIDTVILDVMMPGISSTEVFSRIKATHGHIRVFFSSGYTADLIGKETMARCDGFLAKPYTIKDLATKLGVDAGNIRTGFRPSSAPPPVPTA